MFMYGDLKTIEEWSDKVSTWDSTKMSAADLHAELVRHAGDKPSSQVCILYTEWVDEL